MILYIPANGEGFIATISNELEFFSSPKRELNTELFPEYIAKKHAFTVMQVE